MSTTIRRFGVLALAALFLILATACINTLQMTIPTGPPPVDRSTRAAGRQLSEMKRLMVVPPSGTVRAQFESVLNAIERSLMSSGIVVISPATTARVVADDVGQKTGGQAVGLSDVERALILAKDGAADAVLQLGAWEWAGVHTRRFCGDKPNAMGPCEAGQWSRTRYHGEITGRKLHVTGRLIEVRTGEVLSLIDVQQNTAESFPWTAATRPRASGSDNTFAIKCPELLACDYAMCDACRQAEANATNAVLSTVARIVGPPRPYMGITMRNAEPPDNPGGTVPYGVFVTLVEPAGPAAAAGLVAGDVIVSFNDQEVRTAQRLYELLMSVHGGDVVTLVVEGPRGRQTIPVKVIAR